MNSDLPNGWSWAKIDDLIGPSGVFVDGDWVESKDQNPEGDIRLIQLADIGDGFFRDRSDRYMDYSKAIELNCTFLEKDDVLVARMPDPLGRACLFPFSEKTKYVTVVDVAIIRPGHELALPKLIMFFINSPQFRNSINELQSGTTRKRISRGNLSTIEFPFPPLPEQHRIVDKLERLFARLARAEAAFAAAETALERYRQSMLNEAFKAEDEDGNLKEGWKWVKLGEIISKITAGKSFRCEERPPNQDEIGIVKVSAVTWGEFDEMESKTCFDKAVINANYKIKKGDFLFSRANTIQLVGACVIVKKISKFLMLSDKILRFEFNDLADKTYVLHYLRSQCGRKEIESLSTGNQESMRNIGQERIRQIWIPLPSLEEQGKISRNIELALSTAFILHTTIMQTRKECLQLRQSILHKAFAGQLVSQQADDEPSGVLLERIQKVRAATYSLQKTNFDQININKL